MDMAPDRRTKLTELLAIARSPPESDAWMSPAAVPGYSQGHEGCLGLHDVVLGALPSPNPPQLRRHMRLERILPSYRTIPRSVS